MKILKFISMALVAFVTFSCGQKHTESSKYFAEDLGGVKIVSLYGSWEEMGRQYGELAGPHLRHIHNEFIAMKVKDDPGKEVAVSELATKLYSRYPYRFRKFMEGASQTSGLSLSQLKVVNAVEYAEGCYCSGMAVWGEFASGNLVYGRNYDAASFKPIGKDVLITVYHPSDGSLAVATIGYAGELYAVNAINEKGLFLELNNGMLSAGFDILFDRFSSTASLLEVLFDAPDMDYMDAFFKTQSSFAAFIVGVADQSEARSYEWSASGMQRADVLTPDGLMVMTNHYVNPIWTYPVLVEDGEWMSLTRRSNLLSQAAANKGLIDAEMMCKLMSTPVEEGGTLNKNTRYQLVYEPRTMRLLVRIESADRWTDVDMMRFFL